MHLFQGSISQGEPRLQPVNQPTISATETSVSAPAPSVGAAEVATVQHPATSEPHSAQLDKCNSVSVINTVMTSSTHSAPTATSTPAASVATKHPTVCSVNVAPYKKPISTISRRNFTSPFIVRNGHKVQCLMVPPKNLTSGQYTLVAQLPEDTVIPNPSWS